jgi:hypothetical protein
MGSWARDTTYSLYGSRQTWSEGLDVKNTAAHRRHDAHRRIWPNYHRHNVGGDGNHTSVCGFEAIHENKDKPNGGVG